MSLMSAIEPHCVPKNYSDACWICCQGLQQSLKVGVLPPVQGVLSLKWGDRAQRLYVGAADHNLRIYQTSQPAA